MRKYLAKAAKHKRTTVVCAGLLGCVLPPLFGGVVTGWSAGWVSLGSGLAAGLIVGGLTWFGIASYGPDAEQRIFSPRTAEELVLEAKSAGTSIARESAIERHVGQWLHIYGDFDDIMEVDGKRLMVVVNQNYDSPSYWLMFDKEKWWSRLGSLNVGDRIIVDGKITAVDALGIVHLDECELVEESNR